MNRNFISKIRISKVTDYAALNMLSNKLLTIGIPSNWNSTGTQRKARKKALELYTLIYSEIIPLHSLKLGTYQIMALKEYAAKHGDKFIIILEASGLLKHAILTNTSRIRSKIFLRMRISKPIKIQREVLYHYITNH